MTIDIWIFFKDFGLLRCTNMMELRCQTWTGRGPSNLTLGDCTTSWARTSTENICYYASWKLRHVTSICGGTHDRSWVKIYIVLTELALLHTNFYFISHFWSHSVYLERMRLHVPPSATRTLVSMCVSVLPWLDHFKECMIITEYYSGR